MSRSGSIVLRILGVLILFALLLGAGAVAYQAGYSRGLVEGQSLAALSSGESSAQPLPPAYGVYPGYWPRPFYGFSPFGLFCGGLVFIFLFFLALRLLFRPRFWGPWGRHPGYGYGYGPDYGPDYRRGHHGWKYPGEPGQGPPTGPGEVA